MTTASKLLFPGIMVERLQIVVVARQLQGAEVGDTTRVALGVASRIWDVHDLRG
jgi:hypothetical protein